MASRPRVELAGRLRTLSGAGNGGTVQVTAGGPLTLERPRERDYRLGHLEGERQCRVGYR